jgi:hypothetical protein
MAIHIRNHGPIRAGFAALALSLGSGAACAQDAEDYDWLGIAYLWASDIQADAKNANAGVDFSDVLDKLEMAGQAHVEVQGDDLGGLIDFTFLGLGDQSSRPLVNLNGDLDLILMDLALVFSPGTERLTGFEIFGGLRYIDADFRLVIDPVPPGPPEQIVGIDDTFTDLLVGARYISPLSDRWRLIVSGDVSGADTEGTWSLGAFAGYRTGAHHFIAGYRHLEIEISGGGDTVEQTFTGPVVAYGFSF